MDKKQTIKWLRQSAEEGNARAQFKLGLTYAHGGDVGKDEAEAISWWQRSAINKNSQASYCLGVAYEYGIGVKADKHRALQYYQKAQDRGFNFARSIKFGPKYKAGSRPIVTS